MSLTPDIVTPKFDINFLTSSGIKSIRLLRRICHETTKEKNEGFAKTFLSLWYFSVLQMCRTAFRFRRFIIVTFWSDDKTDLFDTKLYMKGTIRDKPNDRKMKNWNITIPFIIPLMFAHHNSTGEILKNVNSLIII